MDDTITKTPDYEPIQNLIATLLGTGKKYDIDKIKRAFVMKTSAKKARSVRVKSLIVVVCMCITKSHVSALPAMTVLYAPVHCPGITLISSYDLTTTSRSFEPEHEISKIAKNRPPC